MTLSLYGFGGKVEVVCTTNNQVLSNIPGFKNTINCPSDIVAACAGFVAGPPDPTTSSTGSGGCSNCNQGVCESGACVCPSGFSGATCAQIGPVLGSDEVELTLTEYDLSGVPFRTNLSLALGIDISFVQIVSSRPGPSSSRIVLVRLLPTGAKTGAVLKEDLEVLALAGYFSSLLSLFSSYVRVFFKATKD
jgi:hypothetical protein